MDWHWRDFGSQHPVIALCWMMKNMKIPTHQLGNRPSLLRSSLPWLGFPQGFRPLYNDGWFFGMVLLVGWVSFVVLKRWNRQNRDQLISCCKFFDDMTTEWNTSAKKTVFVGSACTGFIRCQAWFCLPTFTAICCPSGLLYNNVLSAELIVKTKRHINHDGFTSALTQHGTFRYFSSSNDDDLLPPAGCFPDGILRLFFPSRKLEWSYWPHDWQ